MGHVFDAQSGELRPKPAWTFSAIEPLFDAVVAKLGSMQTEYTLYGHSAGSQFVHRFLYYMPEARVRRYLAANAGWYMMPDFDTPYPYGLNGAGLDEQALVTALGKDVVLLLGREDIDHNDSSLRKSPEAQRQGANRFARGNAIYDLARTKAQELGADFDWKLVIVDDAGHVNAEMARAASLLVE
jgi:pimeloyl-ACP methyl ester carboxylesterase